MAAPEKPPRLAGRLIIVGPPGRGQVFKTKTWLDSLGVPYEENHQDETTFLVGDEFTVEARHTKPKQVTFKDKEVLHEILRGMDPYLSVGVPEVYWNLAIRLTGDIYGQAGVALLESSHKTYDASVDARDEIIAHSLDPIDPEEIIERLEALPKDE